MATIAEPVRITHSTIHKCDIKVVRLLCSAYIELIDNGYADSGFPYWNTDRTLAIWDAKNDLIGMLAYRILKDQNVIFVAMTAVNPEYRNQRVHNRLHSALDEIAKREGVTRVHSSCSIHNEASIKAYTRYGSECKTYTISRTIPQENSQ